MAGLAVGEGRAGRIRRRPRLEPGAGVRVITFPAACHPRPLPDPRAPHDVQPSHPALPEPTADAPDFFVEATWP